MATNTAPPPAAVDNGAYPTAPGYLTERIRNRYISTAIDGGLLPREAHRMADVISLAASRDRAKPIQFWQLYSVLGRDRIVAIVGDFYRRVYADEAWFRDVFARVGPVNHHVRTQSAMWIDVMGGGLAYHGGEFRLEFHHTHNAMALMNDRGAERWAALMNETLDNPAIDLAGDPRVRPALNTMLTFFIEKYASDFNFATQADFGPVNPPLKRRINFLNMTTAAIEALSEDELRDELGARGIDLDRYPGKTDLVNKALSL